MKCATTSLLLALGATASHAFVPTTSRSTTTTTTALPVYHYRNGPDPDPSSKSSSSTTSTDNNNNNANSNKRGVKPVFPTYTQPDPQAKQTGTQDEKYKKKAGLQPVFLDWENVGFSADGLQRKSS